MTRVVVVTGASAGVGRATVRAFAREGARIGLIARGLEGLQGAKRDVEALGGEALVLQGDVADAAFVEDAARRVEEAFGPIDVWVNNAMASVFTAAWDGTPEEYERVTKVTYLGQVHGSLAALRRMRPRDRGVIVSVGSALAYRAIPFQAPYCAAKHAVKAFHESLRVELAHEGSRVRVCMAHLPAMNTPQFRWSRNKLAHTIQPFPPIFQPEIAAEAIVHLSHHPRRERYVGAATARVIYGERAAPWVVDRYLARTGYEGQTTDEPEDPDRPDNLFRPVEGDHGAHGVFDAEATATSPQVWMTEHRGLVGLAAAGLLVGFVLARQALTG